MSEAKATERTVTAHAERVFGKRAATWLRRPSRALGGAAPLALLDSEAGAKAVDDLLGRIEHGISA